MRLLDLVRRKGEIAVRIVIRDLPVHEWSSTMLCLTRVQSSDSPFPATDPGAPFHRVDYEIAIAEGPGPVVQPLAVRTKQPVGHYYVFLRVMLSRRIRDQVGLQIENFNLSGGAATVHPRAALEFNGGLTWPSVPDDELHNYGSVDELLHGSA